MKQLRKKRRLELELERWLAIGSVKALYEAHERAEEARRRLYETLGLDPHTLSQPMMI